MIFFMWYYQIDAPREIAEMLILSLTCVDALSSSRLSRITMAISFVLQAEHLEVRRFVVCNSLWVTPLRRTPYLLG